jgi:hypothetical protein
LEHSCAKKWEKYLISVKSINFVLIFFNGAQRPNGRTQSTRPRPQGDTATRHPRPPHFTVNSARTIVFLLLFDPLVLRSSNPYHYLSYLIAIEGEKGTDDCWHCIIRISHLSTNFKTEFFRQNKPDSLHIT